MHWYENINWSLAEKILIIPTWSDGKETYNSFLLLYVEENALQLPVSFYSAELFKNIGKLKPKNNLQTVEQLIQSSYLLL